ncbi:hypothetical protein [uncultured Parasphingopyxis sp.]|uniref:hypothetical protein n=1 Tax=uncultured Parasphingopyxis sp. TaxID=1547918 RepID=UPI002609C09E|nr:hypothetical protein [uncultured Parasphingopyxis sp.]
MADALNPFFEKHGFKFIKSRNCFIRKNPAGFDKFGWSTYSLPTGPKWQAGYFEGYYGIGLRNDAVETVSRVTMPIHGADNQRYAFTIYRAMGFQGDYFSFDPSRDRGLCLRFDHLEEDVEETAIRIESMMTNDGFEWYERYSDPVTLSQDLNANFDFLSPNALVNNPQFLPLVAVSAACVAEPERVQTLIGSWLKAAKERDERFADDGQAMAPEFEKKFGMIVQRAREIGYEVAYG